MDWFDLPDDTHRPADADQSRMRLYIAAGLLGIPVIAGAGLGERRRPRPVR
jgi:hypothetical protein